MRARQAIRLVEEPLRQTGRLLELLILQLVEPPTPLAAAKQAGRMVRRSGGVSLEEGVNPPVAQVAPTPLTGGQRLPRAAVLAVTEVWLTQVWLVPMARAVTVALQ